MSEVVKQFTRLFDGNHGAVGTEEGGCLRFLIPKIDSFEWHLAVHHHLTGTKPPIGVYPMTASIDRAGECEVHWGCVDFDEGEEESWIHAVNLSKVLAKFNVTGWIERSRSKGYHVWCFDTAGRWRSARVVRRGLFTAVQLANAPTREINPKQETLVPGQLGNYVRLPYPGFLKDGMLHATFGEQPRRCMVDDQGHFFGLTQFVKAATHCAGLDGLEKLASFYKEPKKKIDVGTVEYDPDTSAVDEDLVALMNRKAFMIWRDGPLEGSDRSSTLYRLASIMNEDGIIEPEEALTLLRDADARWGKQFESRPGGLKYLVQCIEKCFDVTVEVD